MHQKTCLYGTCPFSKLGQGEIVGTMGKQKPCPNCFFSLEESPQVREPEKWSKLSDDSEETPKRST